MSPKPGNKPPPNKPVEFIDTTADSLMLVIYKIHGSILEKVEQISKLTGSAPLSSGGSHTLFL